MVDWVDWDMVEVGSLENVGVEAVDKVLDADTLVDMAALMASSLYRYTQKNGH